MCQQLLWRRGIIDLTNINGMTVYIGNKCKGKSGGSLMVLWTAGNTLVKSLQRSPHVTCELTRLAPPCYHH